MPVLADFLTLERDLLANPSTSTARFQDPQLVRWTDRGVKAAVAAVRFPESRLTTTAVDSRQEYQLPYLAYAIYRIYVNGQRCADTPGGIDTLEGSQILSGDDGGTGPIPALGGGAAGGTLEQPRWAI